MILRFFPGKEEPHWEAGQDFTSITLQHQPRDPILADFPFITQATPQSACECESLIWAEILSSPAVCMSLFKQQPNQEVTCELATLDRFSWAWGNPNSSPRIYFTACFRVLSLNDTRKEILGFTWAKHGVLPLSPVVGKRWISAWFLKSRPASLIFSLECVHRG